MLKQSTPRQGGRKFTTTENIVTHKPRTCNTPVTNQAFLAGIFKGVDPEDSERPMLVSFPGHPDNGNWESKPGSRDVDLPETNNNYTTFATFHPDASGTYRRKKEQFAAIYAVILDDVGVKVSEDKITLPPSGKLETSPGNFQFLYILKEPITDPAVADQLINDIIAAGLTDPGASGPCTRLGRLPVATNGKHNFRCQLHEWEPERRYSEKDIRDGLNVPHQSRTQATQARRRQRADLNHTHAEVEALLGCIEPPEDYDAWLHILMAIHEKTNGSAAGLELADEWSSRGPNYSGTDELEAKWKSFTANQNDGITFASVVQMAGKVLLEKAKRMSDDTDAAKVEALIGQAAYLPELPRKAIQTALKKHANVAATSFNAVVRARAKGIDHGEIGEAVVETFGDGNLLAVDSRIYLWNKKGKWVIVKEGPLRKKIQHYLKSVGIKRTKNLVDSVLALIKAEIDIPEHKFNVGPPSCVNLLNGEATLIEGVWWLQPHTRDHFRTIQVPINFDPTATAPLFKKFLSDLFRGDKDADDKVQAILELIGYTLMSHTKHPRYVILVGEGSNGKSVLLDVIQALCGAENASSIAPSTFGRMYELVHLVDKLVNIAGETGAGELLDDAILKQVVSGEAISVSQKFQPTFLMSPYATNWFGTNNMPATRDLSHGMFRRAMIFKFNNTFTEGDENHDPNLLEKLLTELPGILILALDAYAAALKNGFTEPASSIQAKEDWRLSNDQVQQFVTEMCKTDPDGKVAMQTLYNAYRAWADNNGITLKVTMRTFGERLERLKFGRHRFNWGMAAIGVVLHDQDTF